ncbi:MAG: transporter substrate-binding domain-containing protein [Ferrovibrio sp.]
MGWRVVFLCVLAVLLAARPAQAETWRIACDDNFPPYNYVENGRVVGLDAEIITALAKQAGAEVEFEPQSWSRVQDMLARGEVDAAFQFVGRPDRFEKFFMIGPHRVGHTVFAARQGVDVNFSGLDSLRGYRIGQIRGYTYGASFDTAAGLIKDSSAGDNLQLVRMLAAGRVDVIIGDRDALMHFARSDGLHTQMRMLTPGFAEVPRYIAVPRNRPAIAARMEKALADMRSNGGLAGILKRWE